MRIEIPTALTNGEANILQQLSQGVNVIEAGSLLGFSTVVMAQVADQVVAVDPHDGYPWFAPRPTFDAFTENIRRYGVASRVLPLVGTAEQHFPGRRADVAFLDLTGAYDLTLRAINLAFQVAPIVAVHDYERGGCHGATEAVDLVVRSRRLEVTRRDTLVVLS